MDSGVRTKQHHFCPTNPQTITRIKEHAAKLFSRAMPDMAAQEPQAVHVFHLWPDHGHEETWCACPACRAFTPAEQNRIAVNTAADALAELDPEARLSYLELSGENCNFQKKEKTGGMAAAGGPVIAGYPSALDGPDASGGIVPRNNTFIFNAAGYATLV